MWSLIQIGTFLEPSSTQICVYLFHEEIKTRVSVMTTEEAGEQLQLKLKLLLQTDETAEAKECRSAIVCGKTSLTTELCVKEEHKDSVCQQHF